MQPSNLLDRTSVEQVATLLKNGGTAQHLGACEVLMQSIPAALVRNLTHSQRVNSCGQCWRKRSVLITGSSDLSMGWSISVRPSAVGGEHDSESVVIKIFEAVGQPADLLDDQVDGFGAAVGDP